MISHKNVLKISDNSNTGNVEISNRFSENQTYGIIELWVRTTQHRRSYIKITEAAENVVNQVDLSLTPSGTLDYYDTTWHTIQSISLNEWYHFKIEFNCSAKWDLWINGVKKSGSGWDYWGTPNMLSTMHLISDNTNTNWNLYYDAIGYSWDPKYNASDNLNEGLLLSYNNSTALDWQGFSLDGTLNKTVLGNTTIPLPDGKHSIQLFGNNSLGTMYESTVRYFSVDTVPPILLITYPLSVQEFSAPPAYVLSITETNIASMGYTLNGGTEIPITSEMGTIDASAWNSLADGPITIRFYLRDIADREVFQEVIVIKVASDVPTTPPGIPGYNIIAILGLCSIITLILIRKQRGRIKK